jgi:hypothetical protein
MSTFRELGAKVGSEIELLVDGGLEPGEAEARFNPEPAVKANRRRDRNSRRLKIQEG